MSWALRRQILCMAIFILFVAFVVFLIVAPNLNKTPTCSDNKQNGNEEGIDCGGLCLRECASKVSAISILWARSFKVIPGRYNVVAYLINHNKNNAIEKISYRFRFADKNNVYIGKRDGSTFIPPAGNFAIFEPGINIGNSIPVYTTFEFIESPLWLQVSQEKINQLKILVSDIKLIDETTSPRLSATVRNNSLFTIPDMNVIAILYDSLGNAVSASRTYLNQLDSLQNADVHFTWPEPFSSTIVTKEIIPMYNIFSVKLQ